VFERPPFITGEKMAHGHHVSPERLRVGRKQLEPSHSAARKLTPARRLQASENSSACRGLWSISQKPQQRQDVRFIKGPGLQCHHGARL